MRALVVLCIPAGWICTTDRCRLIRNSRRRRPEASTGLYATSKRTLQPKYRLLPARVARVAAIFPLENGPTLRPRQLYKRRRPVKRAIKPRYPPASPAPLPLSHPLSTFRLSFVSSTAPLSAPARWIIALYRCFLPGLQAVPAATLSIDGRVAFSQVNET